MMQIDGRSGFHPIWIVLAGLSVVVVGTILAFAAVWADRVGEASQAKTDLQQRANSPAHPPSITLNHKESGGSTGAGEKAVPVKPSAALFVPPDADSIPMGPFGDKVRLGRDVFVETQRYAKAYVGNGLNCVNCHMDAGRKENAAPLWAAYVAYPAYRDKNHQVNTYQDRLAGCFKFSMNGSPPPVDSEIMTALVTYSYWLAKGAPVGADLPGRGYPKLGSPPLDPDADRGKRVYEQRCAFCHGIHGEGTKTTEGYAFPPLWGKQSFNGGAGMSRVPVAASFIKANMPLGLGGSLSDQEAWDVAQYIDSQPRPPDPRKPRH